MPHRFSLVSSGAESNADFWYRIADELNSRYKLNKRAGIYIHGDGAAWIKTGLGIIRGSRYILDKFHLLKELRKLAGGEQRYLALLKSCVYNNSFEILRLSLCEAFQS